LRYLLLIAALLSPRPPAFLALNEPEASLHPDLLAPLARLIEKASERSQIVVVTHARALAAQLSDAPDVRLVSLEKSFGETMVEGARPPNWVWPTR
jgi:predicted ATPase